MEAIAQLHIYATVFEDSSFPPIFYLVKEKTKKPVWTLELDPLENKFMKVETLPTDVLYVGQITKVEGNKICAENNKHQAYEEFPASVAFAISTWMNDNSAMAIAGKYVLPMRLIDRNKYANHVGVLQSEQDHFFAVRREASSSQPDGQERFQEADYLYGGKANKKKGKRG